MYGLSNVYYVYGSKATHSGKRLRTYLSLFVTMEIETIYRHCVLALCSWNASLKKVTVLPAAFCPQSAAKFRIEF